MKKERHVSTKTVPELGGSTTPAAPDRISMFQRMADKVSYGMGTPLNIFIWVVIVVGWTLIFALHLVSANATFLPTWFTGTAFNFPLNLVTTVAELYIGFLVGASSNRSERNLETTLGRIGAQEQQITNVELKLSKSLELNTTLTREIHELTKVIHGTVCASK
jgi:hypothetical protein